MRVQKRILEVDRLRRVPTTGFSWVDRRFVRDHARALSRDSVLLYFFLAAVCDKDGLSYYGDDATARILGMTQSGVYAARNELTHRDLIAYESPFYQVLSVLDASQRQAGQQIVIRDLLTRLEARGGCA